MSFDSRFAEVDEVLLGRFGRAVLYTPVGDAPRTITGLFQNPAQPSDIGTRAVQASAPSIYVLKSDVPDARKDDQFRIDKIDYRVIRKIDDEGACVLVKLEELS